MDRVVAIDGPVGVGKSSVARAAAAALGFRHLDTGAMYRAVALVVMQHHAGRFPTESELGAIAASVRLRLLPEGQVIMDGRDISGDIRTEAVSRFVSRVADSRAVREALVEEQRRLGRECPSVMEGRDIGTVVFPESACKIYLDAAPRVRAARRVAQLQSMNLPCDSEAVFRDLMERDAKDRNRPWGALRLAPDAIILDSTSMSESEVVAAVCALVRANPWFAPVCAQRAGHHAAV